MGYTELVKKLRYDSLLVIEPLSSELVEAADAVETLQRACANYAEQACENETKWIPVTERLPEKPGKYLVRYDMLECVNSADTDILWFTDNLYRMNKYAFPGKKNKRPGFYSTDNEYGEAEWDCVTHWMPLPEPPKEGAE